MANGLPWTRQWQCVVSTNYSVGLTMTKRLPRKKRELSGSLHLDIWSGKFRSGSVINMVGTRLHHRYLSLDRWINDAKEEEMVRGDTG